MIRKLLDRLVFGKSRGADLVHVPVGSDSDAARDRRARALSVARERKGSAFRCAAADQDREVIVTPGLIRVIGAGRPATSRPAPFIHLDGVDDPPRASVKVLRFR